MANTAVRLGQAAMSALATLYTATGKCVLKSFDICNTTQQTLAVRVFVVPSGGSATTATAILYDYLIGPADHYGWEGEQVLENGDLIRIYGSAAGCTITASGLTIA